MKIKYFIKILFWISFSGFLSCISFAPREGVFTHIQKVKSTSFRVSGNVYQTISNNSLTQTIAQAKDFAINHGGRIFGNFTVYYDTYCCFNPNYPARYITIFKRDNIIVNNNIQYVQMPPSQILENVDDKLFTIHVTFDDPAISMPESHVYTIEFWECLGECKPIEYDKKTDKKAEIVINYSVTP